MHNIMDPTVGTFAGFIVEPIDVLTMDMEDTIRTPMEDILRTPMEDILRTPTEDIIVRPISGDGVFRRPSC
jgi:phage baseplate assembly protein W